MSTPSQPFARTDRTTLGLWWWTTDRFLLAAIALLIGIGVALSFGASPAIAVQKHLNDPFRYAIRQAMFGLGGAALLLGMSILSPKGVRRVSFFVYLIAIVMMAALPVITLKIKAAHRWLQMGGFSLQPSEFMKPALIVMAAWMFAEGQKGEGVPGVSIAFFLYFLAVMLLLLQPDFGQTVLITLAFGVTFFMAGVPLRWIMAMSGAAAVGFITISLSFAHVHDRIQRFLSTDKSE
jgi:cell division protein FtsW